MNRNHHATLAPGAHRYRLRVYYDDTDAGGVVYHANYLRMAERARTEALRDKGVPHAELTSQHGLIFVVRRINLDYVAPARLDDLLEVVTESVALGSASLELRQSVFRVSDAPENELPTRALVVAEVVLVCVGRSPNNKEALMAARIPQRWRAALAPPQAA